MAGTISRSAVLATLCVVSVAISGRAVASGSAVPVRLRAHVSLGLELLMSVPRHRYPRNSLVRVTLTLHNQTHRTMLVKTNCGAPIVAYVENRARRAVSFPGTASVVGGFPGGCGHPSGPLRMPADGQYTVHQYVILSGPYIAADIGLQASNPAIKVRLGRQHGRPKLQLMPEPHLAIRVVRPPGVRGHFRYIDSTMCSTSPPNGSGGPAYSYAGHYYWTTSRSPIVKPGVPSDCSAVLAWQLVAGWPGHSVATLDYSRPPS